MEKHKEITDPRSCFNKARLREKMFVFLGRDASAIAGVRAWIADRLRRGVNTPDDPQVTEAQQWCYDLEQNHYCSCSDWFEDPERKGNCGWCAKPISFKG